MPFHRRALLGASLALPALRPAAAQAFPSRALRFIVPIAPGGANDILARMVVEKLPALLGQPAVVENRPGAGGNIGGLAVAQAEKDGHTLLFGSVNVLAANKFLYGSRMPFDAERDFAPVTRVGIGTILMVCNAARPWRSFAELVAAAKARPGTISMGSSGTGTISHLYMEKVKRAAGVDITHIPYRGGGPAITDLVAGTIDIMFDVMPALLPHIREGRFRPLAVGSAARLDYVPELSQVPAMEELLPGQGIDALNWWSAVAPAGTPPAVLATLNGAIRQVVAQEDVARRMLGLTIKPATDATPAEFGAYWKSQIPVWQALVAESGATAE